MNVPITSLRTQKESDTFVFYVVFTIYGRTVGDRPPTPDPETQHQGRKVVGCMGERVNSLYSYVLDVFTSRLT